MRKYMQMVTKAVLMALSFCILQCSAIGTVGPGKPGSANLQDKILSSVQFPFDSVYKIDLVDYSNERYLSGTTWLMAPSFSKKIFEGYPVMLFVTAGHICKSISEIKHILKSPKIVISSPFTDKKYTANSMYYNFEQTDLCVLYDESQIDNSVTGFSIRETELTPMENVYSVQGPYGVFPLVFRGNISYHSKDSGMVIIGIIAHPGSSGSPVFDENNEVIGVVSKVHVRGTGITICVDNFALIDFMRSFVYNYNMKKEVEKLSVSYSI